MSEPKPPPAWLDNLPEPRAEITRAGRWTYRVVVKEGIGQWGPNGYGWTVLGRRRAERKAAKVLARYQREQERQRDVTIVT